jgi:hypothetical protein
MDNVQTVNNCIILNNRLIFLTVIQCDFVELFDEFWRNVVSEEEWPHLRNSIVKISKGYKDCGSRYMREVLYMLHLTQVARGFVHVSDWVTSERLLRPVGSFSENWIEPTEGYVYVCGGCEEQKKLQCSKEVQNAILRAIGDWLPRSLLCRSVLAHALSTTRSKNKTFRSFFPIWRKLHSCSFIDFHSKILLNVVILHRTPCIVTKDQRSSRRWLWRLLSCRIDPRLHVVTSQNRVILFVWASLF